MLQMIQQILSELGDYRAKLINHPLYNEVKTINDLKCFTEQHVFAVWDFMSLLKSLQCHLTTTNVPWTPSANPKTRRFINEIVFCEESDVNENGEPMSHYEMYLEAMQQIGADTTLMNEFCCLIESGKTIENSFDLLKVPQPIRNFVNFTFSVIETNKPHVIAAVFTFGREDLIPDMFIEIVKSIGQKSNISKLVYYLERHIELDGDEHGPISLRMVDELCSEDNEKWSEVLSFSKEALRQRLLLWDFIHQKVIDNKLISV